MTKRWAHVIILDRATDEQREAVHAVVKEHARGWWHHMTDAWIVFGHTAKQWRDWTRDAARGGPASVLVLTLPDDPGRRWAYVGPDAKKRMEWVHRNYK